MDTAAFELWNQVLSHLQVQLSRPTYEAWIRTAQPLTLSDTCLTIQTPNTFARNWLQKNYVTTISTVAEAITGQRLDIQIVVASQSPEEPVAAPAYPPAPPLEIASTSLSRSSDLNPKYTFDRFVVGTTNRMAHAAALAIAEMPGQAYNPFFLCGRVGLGKTHIMQAIGHYCLEINPNAKVFYVSTERFTNDLIDAIRRDSMQAFREHYRDVDVLMVDDIQFIEGKEYTQEEFFHTFNALHERGKQIVLAADRSPHLIPRLQDRLCSRFSMGLIAEINSPDLETRMAILKKKADYEGMSLPHAVIEYIASTFTSNIRELEGALIRAVAYVSIAGVPMTVANLEPVLDAPREMPEITPEAVLAAVADSFQLSVDDLIGISRKRSVSVARQVAMFLMRHHIGLSLNKIGLTFGGKDHTTVLYSCEKVEQMQREDPILSRQIQDIAEQLYLTNRPI